MIDVEVRLLPKGDTTKSELATMRRELWTAVERIDVAKLEPVRLTAPDGAKGVAEDTAAFLVSIPAPLLQAVVDVVKIVLGRPGRPLTILKITGNGAELQFDPRVTSLEALAEFIERVMQALKKA